MNLFSAILPAQTTYQQANKLATEHQMNLYQANGRYLVTNLPPRDPWTPANPISTEIH